MIRSHETILRRVGRGVLADPLRVRTVLRRSRLDRSLRNHIYMVVIDGGHVNANGAVVAPS